MIIYQDNGRTIVVRVKEGLDRFDFKEVLRVLKEEFQEEKLEFKGWLNGSKVVGIGGGDNYIILPGSDRIKLKLTKVKDCNSDKERRKMQAI